MNRSSGLFWGIVLILLGLLFLVDNLDIMSVGEAVRDYWPVLLVLWGVWMISSGPFATRRGQKIPGDREGDLPGTAHAASNVFGDVREQTKADTAVQSTIFGDLDITMESSNFRGGMLSTVFGDCACDLTRCSLSSGEQVFHATTVFGNVTVLPPQGVPRALAAHTLFGKIKAGGQTRDGFSSSLIVQDASYAGTGSKIRIDLSTVFGDIKLGA